MGTFVGFSLRYLEIEKSTEKPVYKLLTAYLGLLLIEAEYAEKLAARRKEIQEILDQMDSKATSTNNNGRDLHERKDCASFKVVSSIVLWSFGLLPQEEETKLQAEEHLRLVQARFLGLVLFDWPQQLKLG